MKFEKFYSKKHNSNFYILILKTKLEKFKDDMYCDKCLKAELYKREGINKKTELHLAKKPSSVHEDWCIHTKKIEIATDDFISKIELKEINNQLKEINQLKDFSYEEKMKKLKEINDNYIITIEDETKKVVPKELKEGYYKNEEDTNRLNIYYGRVKIKRQFDNKYYSVYTLTNYKDEFIIGLQVNNKLTERIDENLEREIFFTCKAEIIKNENTVNNRIYYNLRVNRKENYEIFVEGL
ncbi:hypothetical protein [Cetobacterium sp.]|uniref:hypothetical protein n=2 Tax=Cetobacterium sp. TaxID=2071632 RepID=UPI003F35F773